MISHLRAAKFIFNKMPSHLIFFVTGRCNAKCKHCFYWKNISRADVKKELSLDEISKISKSMGHVKILSMTGGEPLLRNDLADIAEIFYKNNDLHHMVLHSNGLMPDKVKRFSEEVIAKCPDMTLMVSLSIDDFEKQHDEIRGVVGNFKKTMEAIDNLQDLRRNYKNFEVAVVTVASYFNYKNIKDLIDFIKNEVKIDAHQIELVRGSTMDEKARIINPEEYKDIIDHLKKTRFGGEKKADYPFASLRKVVDTLTPEIEIETAQKKKMILPCMAGKTVIVLDEKGDIHPCELLDISFGNVRDFDYNMKKILFSKTARDIKNWIKRSKCFCTWGCAISNSIIFNLKAYPRIIKRWADLK